MQYDSYREWSMAAKPDPSERSRDFASTLNQSGRRFCEHEIQYDEYDNKTMDIPILDLSTVFHCFNIFVTWAFVE